MHTNACFDMLQIFLFHTHKHIPRDKEKRANKNQSFLFRCNEKGAVKQQKLGQTSGRTTVQLGSLQLAKIAHLFRSHAAI